MLLFVCVLRVSFCILQQLFYSTTGVGYFLFHSKIIYEYYCSAECCIRLERQKKADYRRFFTTANGKNWAFSQVWEDTDRRSPPAAVGYFYFSSLLVCDPHRM